MASRFIPSFNVWLDVCWHLFTHMHCTFKFFSNLSSYTFSSQILYLYKLNTNSTTNSLLVISKLTSKPPPFYYTSNQNSKLKRCTSLNLCTSPLSQVLSHFHINIPSSSSYHETKETIHIYYHLSLSLTSYSLCSKDLTRARSTSIHHPSRTCRVTSQIIE